MYDARQHIVEVAALIYQRGLSDSAGGNISLRHEGLVYVSPRRMGSKYRYQIRPEHISVLEEVGHGESYNILDGPRELSREVRLHLAVYAAFPEVGAVIHAHPHWLTVLAVAGRAMQPVLEFTQKFGTTECIPATQMHTQALADEVVKLARQRRAQVAQVGLGVLLPAHGVAVLGQDLDNAYDILERLEDNARCLLLARLLEA